MASSKKNLFTVIIITSILLFVFAVYWKISNPDNSEIVNIKSLEVNSTNQTKTKKGFDFLEDEKKQTNQENTNSEIDDVENKNKIIRKMNNAMMYTSPDQIMKSITYYQEQGDDENVNELINMLIERFPEYELPQDL